MIRKIAARTVSPWFTRRASTRHTFTSSTLTSSTFISGAFARCDAVRRQRPWASLLVCTLACMMGMSSCGISPTETRVFEGVPVKPFTGYPVAQVSEAISTGNLCTGLISDVQSVPVELVQRPPYLEPYRDPAFGTRVTRITDSRVGEVYKPAYSTVQAWNADESLLLLYYSGGDYGRRSGRRSGPVLLDGHTYEILRELPVTPVDIEEMFWSHSDPDILFYVSKNSRNYGDFRRFDVSSGKSTKITDFNDYCGRTSLPTGGSDVHMQSLDDDLFGFRCAVGNDQWRMLTYRVSTDEVTAAPIGEGTEWEAWTAPQPAPSGRRIWFQGASIEPDLATVERRMDMSKTSEHSSLGRTHEGQDALFQTVFDPSPGGCNGDSSDGQGVGHLVVHNLETGECRPVINEARGYPYTTSGTHVSAVSVDKPGWVAMSSVGYDQFEWLSNKQPAPPLFSEVYLANTDPANEVVCRLAQHRSFGKAARKGGYKSYLGEPHATISPSGTRILFGSDWYDSGSVDAYVIELPGYQPPG